MWVKSARSELWHRPVDKKYGGEAISIEVKCGRILLVSKKTRNQPSEDCCLQCAPLKVGD